MRNFITTQTTFANSLAFVDKRDMLVPLPNIIYRHKKRFQYKLEDLQLPSLWQEEIKKIHPSASMYTNHHKLQKNILYIKVLDPVWLVELEPYKQTILKALNTKRIKPLKAIRFLI